MCTHDRFSNGDYSLPEMSAKDILSTCVACGKKAKSEEFIIPHRYCSQSCADKNGYDQMFGSRLYVDSCLPQ